MGSFDLWTSGSSRRGEGVSHAIYIFHFSIYLTTCGILVVVSSSLTEDQTQAPCTGSLESEPLDHQGSPSHAIVYSTLSTCFLYCFGGFPPPPPVSKAIHRYYFKIYRNLQNKCLRYPPLHQCHHLILVCPDFSYFLICVYYY